MNLQNTTNGEDHAILQARNFNPVESLLEIIERLDGIIEAWKDASGCETPEGLEEVFRSIMMGADE